MRQVTVFGDSRWLCHCAICGSTSDHTRDHVPPKILLDDPLPENLPVIQACEYCNQELSLDEEYVACLVECVVSGSTHPAEVTRPKISRILERKPALRRRISEGMLGDDPPVFTVELDRLSRVMLKLARGHAAYELYELQLAEPDHFGLRPLALLSRDERQAFELPPNSSVLPEIGSRAFTRLFSGDAGWQMVQPGRYRYLAMLEHGDVVVRMVLSEYLACEVWWP